MLTPVDQDAQGRRAAVAADDPIASVLHGAHHNRLLQANDRNAVGQLLQLRQVVKITGVGLDLADGDVLDLLPRGCVIVDTGIRKDLRDVKGFHFRAPPNPSSRHSLGRMNQIDTISAQLIRFLLCTQNIFQQFLLPLASNQEHTYRFLAHPTIAHAAPGKRHR